MRFFQTERNTAALRVGYAPGPQWFTHREVDYWGRVRPALTVSTIVVGVTTVVTCIWVFLLQREFRWAIYRHISGSLQMLRRYLAYQVTLHPPFLKPKSSLEIADCVKRSSLCLSALSHTSLSHS